MSQGRPRSGSYTGVAWLPPTPAVWGATWSRAGVPCPRTALDTAPGSAGTGVRCEPAARGPPAADPTPVSGGWRASEGLALFSPDCAATREYR